MCSLYAEGLRLPPASEGKCANHSAVIPFQLPVSFA
jgi:hypothetical protein